MCIRDSHEVGHYFNLRHIWGDTPDCSGTDMVADTPNCAGPNFGTPTWPVIPCNHGPNGDMFMNDIRWVHAFEEDAPGVLVYRQATGEVPLSRRPRDGFELRRNGTAQVFT